MSTFPSRETFTGTFTDTIFWNATIKTLHIIDFALIDFIFAVWLGGTNRTVDAFISTNKVDTGTTIVTWVRVTFVNVLVTILTSPSNFASAFEITGPISALAVDTW